MTASLIFSGRRSARSGGGLPVDGTEGGLPLAAVAVGDAGLSAVADFWTAVTSGLTGSPMSQFYAISNVTKVSAFAMLRRDRWRDATERWIGTSAGDAENLAVFDRVELTSSKGLLDPPSGPSLLLVNC